MVERNVLNEFRMQSAINPALNIRRKGWVVCALVLIVLAYGIQPCFAMGPAATSHPCCPSKLPTCHKPSQPAACTMNGAAFAPPEASTGAHPVHGDFAQPLASLAPPSHSHEPTGSQTCPPGRGRVFLLNSVLLI